MKINITRERRDIFDNIVIQLDDNPKFKIPIIGGCSLELYRDKDDRTFKVLTDTINNMFEKYYED